MLVTATHSSWLPRSHAMPSAGKARRWCRGSMSDWHPTCCLATAMAQAWRRGGSNGPKVIATPKIFGLGQNPMGGLIRGSAVLGRQHICQLEPANSIWDQVCPHHLTLHALSGMTTPNNMTAPNASFFSTLATGGVELHSPLVVAGNADATQVIDARGQRLCSAWRNVTVEFRWLTISSPWLLQDLAPEAFNYSMAAALVHEEAIQMG